MLHIICFFRILACTLGVPEERGIKIKSKNEGKGKNYKIVIYEIIKIV